MQNLKLTLRPAGTGDWPALAALLQANQLPLDGARQHLSTFLLATHKGELIGSAGAEVHGTVALLRSVAVAPGLHGQGIGRALVSRLLEEAARRQIGSVHLLTVTAPDFFAQFGFQPEPIDRAPPGLKASAEFQGACPASAAFMSLASPTVSLMC